MPLPPSTDDLRADDLDPFTGDAGVGLEADEPAVPAAAQLAIALEDALGADPDDEADDDAQIEQYLARASSTNGREHLSALSALSQQMEAYRPLSPEEQTDCLARHAAGMVARERLRGRRLGALAERAARRDVLDGDRAQTELVASMFRLVLIIAREIAADRYGREKALDILPDLVAEANLALVEAVSTYDAARCPTFSIYAGRVIRDRVRMSLQKASAVGVAPSWLRLKRIYTVLRPEVEMSLGRTPTEPEMQDALRVVCMRWAADRLTEEQQTLPEPEREALMESKLRKQGMLGAIDRLKEVLAATHQVSSLDAPRGEEGASTLGDSLREVTADRCFDAVEHAELREDLMRALSTLTEREQQIVLHRFGFVDGEQWTYAKLAPQFGVSAERIRQIERNVLGKLRSPAFAGLGAHLPSRAGMDLDEDRRR